MSKKNNDSFLTDITNSSSERTRTTPCKRAPAIKRIPSSNNTSEHSMNTAVTSRRNMLFDDPEIQSSVFSDNKTLSLNDERKSTISLTQSTGGRRMTFVKSQDQAGLNSSRISSSRDAPPPQLTRSNSARPSQMRIKNNVEEVMIPRRQSTTKLESSNSTEMPAIPRRKSISKEILRNLTRSNDKSEAKLHQQTQPSIQELDRQLELMMSERDYGDIEKNKLRALTRDQKWVILSDYIQSTKHRLSPRDYISTLRKKADDTTMEHLLLDIKSETVTWIKEFVKLGGVSVISKILEDALEKQKKKNSKPQHYQLIQNSIFVLKALMQTEEGIKAVSESIKTLQLLFTTLDLAILSDRTKVHLLHILAGISTLKENAHKIMLSILQKNQLCFITLASSNQEIATACFICLNAVLHSSRYNDPMNHTIKQSFLDKGLGAIIKQWQSQEISQVLRMQLNIFMNTKIAPPPAPSISSSKSVSYSVSSLDNDTLHIVNLLVDKIKDSDMLNTFVTTMIYLTELDPQSKSGKNKWELINMFVKCATIIGEGKDKNEIFKNVLNQFKLMHNSGGEETEDQPESHKTRLGLKKKGTKKKRKSKSSTSELSSVSSNPAPSISGSDSSVSSSTNIPPPPFPSDNAIPLPPGGPGIPPPPPGGPSISPPLPGGPDIPPPPPGGPGIPPPPPPPGGPGIPPPPPPPGGPGIPPPPPPPGSGGGIKKGPGKKEIVIKPDIKMRPFHWNKLNLSSVEDTIWGRMKHNLRFPKEIFQNEFAFIEIENNLLKESSSSGSSSTLIPENKTIILLDQKRWQNISILLSKFPIRDFFEIRNAIYNMDEGKLDSDMIQLLCPFAPLPSELEKLKPYMNEAVPANMGIPEKFFLVLMDVPEVGTRLKLWQFRLQFHSKNSEILERMENLSAACCEVRNSEKFTYILEFVLYMGNFMNCNSSKGGAWGFRLDSLLKLNEIKSKSNPETSLLYYLVEFLLDEYPEVCDFYHDLKSVDKIKELTQITLLNAETQVLESHLLELGDFMGAPPSECGLFRDYMEPFLPEAQTCIDRLKSTYKKVNQEYTSLVEFFGEVKSLPVGTFFDTVRQFLLAFESTKFKISRKAAMQARKNLGKIGISLPASISNGTLDKVIADLTSGQAFDI